MRELVTLKLTDDTVTCSNPDLAINFNVFKYTLKFYTRHLVYDVLEPYRNEIQALSSKELIVPLEFLLEMLENAHIITNLLEKAEEKVGRKIWSVHGGNDQKVLTITTKSLVKTPASIKTGEPPKKVVKVGRGHSKAK